MLKQNFSHLEFLKAQSEDDLNKIYQFEEAVFSETSSYEWSLVSLKKHYKEGWSIYAAVHSGSIVAAIFCKAQGNDLLTKHTAVRVKSRGQGFSHIIKEFLEIVARDQKLARIINHCRQDNFRLISLNEGHGYERTGESVGPQKEWEEWVKVLPA